MSPHAASMLIAVSLLVAPAARGAQTVALPAWVCAHPDAVFVGGFESGESPVPRAPSNGGGGAYPGSVTRQISVPGFVTQPYYLYLPSNYDPRHAWPLLLALHGAGGPNTADTYAQKVRQDWSWLAYSIGAVIAAPVGTDAQGGGWNAPISASDRPTDYDIIAAVFNDVASAYNIETTRRYGWGYSAGGHVMHSLALNGYNAVVNANSLAAYSVSSGALAGWACYGMTDLQCQQLVLQPAARKVPVDIHAGTTDFMLSYALDDDNSFAASGWVPGSTLFFTEFVGDHNYSLTDLQQAWTHLCPNAVAP